MLDSLRARLAALLPGTRQRRAQTEAYREAWAAHNRLALIGFDPALHRLWIALGDSTSQGIGASAHDRGWVGQILDLLGAEAGQEWRLVNLSVTGARIDDVLRDQLPRLAGLPDPDLVTCAVGANDLLRGRPGPTMGAVERLLSGLPPATVVATVPQGLRAGLARRVNDRIRARCAVEDLRLADVWDATGPPWGGKYAADGFHPNDRGYEEWVRAYQEPLGL